jgi:probable rRNA maturation factor
VTVHVLCEHPRGRAAATRLKRRAAACLAALGREDAELSILVVGDRGIRRLNRSWRGKDVATDVLSFPASESAGAMLGDVVISLDTAARVARAERRSIGDELDRYLVHGILHLLGFDHETEREAQAMAVKEDEFLGGHGMVSGAAPTEEAPRARPLDIAPLEAAPRSERTAPARGRARRRSRSSR